MLLAKSCFFGLPALDLCDPLLYLRTAFPYQNGNVTELSSPDVMAVSIAGDAGKVCGREVADEITGATVGVSHCLKKLALHFVACNGAEAVVRVVVHDVYPFLLLLFLLSICSRYFALKKNYAKNSKICTLLC